MKRILNLLLTSAVLLGLGSACKRDGDAVGPNACERANQRAEAVQQAANAYVTAQTRANCEALRRAYNDFLDAADRCTTIPRANINDARASINALDCD